MTNACVMVPQDHNMSKNKDHNDMESDTTLITFQNEQNCTSVCDS